MMTDIGWLLADDQVIDWRVKAFGPGQQGHTVAELIARGTTLADLPTPLVTLDASAIEHNEAVMTCWIRGHGVELAPHGKTSMAPALWHRQLASGAWGLTVATPWQLRVAVASGVQRIQHAGAVVDSRELRHIGALRLENPELEIVVWADSVATVALMVAGYPSCAPPLAVLVERGGPGARTGARTASELLDVASAVTSAPQLRLAGVAAWEGSLQGAAAAGGLEIVARFCDSIAQSFVDLESRGLFPANSLPILTAGGSAYFDIVTSRWEFLSQGSAPRARVVLRSGCYLTHDHGLYSKMSPFARATGPRLVPALHGWARVVSRPEPGLALLDAGRRDLSFDQNLPRPLRVRERDSAASGRALTGARIIRLDDQHAHLALESSSDLAVGEVVQLGVSHPCTTMDKWTVIPVVADADAVSPQLVGAVRTVF